jgi:hypothetical protein
MQEPDTADFDDIKVLSCKELREKNWRWMSPTKLMGKRWVRPGLEDVKKAVEGKDAFVSLEAASVYIYKQQRGTGHTLTQIQASVMIF